MRTERRERQKRIMKPGIYKAILALGIISLYTGAWTMMAGHTSLGLFGIMVSMITMMILTLEENTKYQMKQEEKEEQH